MKGRVHGKGGSAPAAADLLVCFPSRAHLSLMPKPICSPEPTKRLHHLRKSSFSAPGQASPLMWAKSKSFGGIAEMVSEPTSPKVTCAGQIKVRHKAGTCKTWQSVMEEIEKNTRRAGASKKRRPGGRWAEALGFKKEVFQFLTCLRSLRFDFRCFGSFHGADISSDDEDDDDEEDADDADDAGVVKSEKNHSPPENDTDKDNQSSATLFSKWFMVLQEEPNFIHNNNDDNMVVNKRDDQREVAADDDSDEEEATNSGEGEPSPAVPPPNALLLMRCRSAPAKSWLEERAEEEEREGENKVTTTASKRSSLRYLMDEEEKTDNSVRVVMRYDYNHINHNNKNNPDMYDLSSDVSKETWIVGDIRDLLARSRSWKR